MNDIIKLCATALLALCAVLLLRRFESPHARGVIIAAGCVLMFRALLNLSTVASYLRDLTDDTATESYMSSVLRAAGIACLTEFTAEMCRDAGEGAIAGYVEIVGRSELVLLSLPLISELTELSLGMLNL